jgi:uncharacterized membrane protein/membrane-bound inhibitor of C-type lysozyme/heat shock protein HslJ
VRFASAALVGAALAVAACQRADDATARAAADADVGSQRAQSENGASDATIARDTWRLVAIRRPGAGEEPVGPDPLYTVAFGADERYSGRAHCNSLASVTRYEVRGEELLLTYNSSGELRFVRETQATAAAPEVGRTFVFDCDGDVSFTVRTGPGELALWAPASLGGAYQVLSITRAASGARYEEGDTAFSSNGDLATFEFRGQRYVDCRANPREVPWADAARRGATFRALGNEPAWYVEIFPDRLAIVTELGANRTELTHRGPVIEGARTTYRAAVDGRAATVVIERRACADSMSGEGFDAAATVSFEDRTLLGCGRFL